MAYFQVLGGLVLLVFAADFLVRGSVSLAQRLNVHSLVIGLTVVAFGTSAPELLVGIDAVLTDAPTLALGNVVGSNIANVWLVLGVPAVIAPMACNAPKFTRNMLIMLAATGAFIALAYTGAFEWWSGVILLVLLAGFIRYTGRRTESAIDYEMVLAEIEGVPDEPDSKNVAIALIAGGIIGLVVGAHILVQGSVEIARDMGVSEALIGLTLVAIGTSLPELVTAIVAALRGHCDVAFGNVIGSNIFNLLGIIGVSSLIGTIPVPDFFLEIDLWVMALASLSLLPFALMRRHIGRKSGIAFCLTYVSYIVWLAGSAHGYGGTHGMWMIVG